MAESWTLDGLALHDSTFLIRGEGVDMTPPRQKPEWIGAADSEAQLLVRDPFYENRTIVIPMLVAPQTTKDLAFDKIGQIRDKLAKASKYQDGIVLAWTSHGSARTINFDVLAGEITDLPVDFHLAFQNRARLVITLTCKPYWYGTETLTSTTSSSTPFVSVAVANSIGDVPALGRLIVTDTATQSRRHVEWGLEGPLTYNAATSLIVDSDDMVTSGFAGAAATTTGAYDPNAAGNNSISLAVNTGLSAMAGTGNLSHVGVFRVKGRFQTAGTVTRVRFAWRAADGPMTSNTTVTLRGGGTWEEVDLGTVTVPTVISGTQRWTGQVDAETTSGSDTVILDYLVLIPVVDGYGKARAVYTYSPGLTAGRDEFTSTTAGNNLNARVAPAGGTWATSGSATDLQFADDLSGEQLKRATVSDASPRYAILGASTFTDTEVSAKVVATAFPSAVGAQDLRAGVIGRWTDASNHLYGALTMSRILGHSEADLTVYQVVAGVTTVLASTTVTVTAGTVYTVRLLAYAAGRVICALLNADGTTVDSVDITSTVTATGGTLASGKVGIIDTNTTASAATRYYDDFRVATPATEPIVLYSGRNMQFRHEDTIRQDSTGTYTGRPQSYRGSRFLVPVGTSRVLVKARRNDVEVAADDNVTDATQIQIGITPRGLAVPRA